MYYVYEFYIIDTNEIIYVGKGKGRRYKVKSQRNQLLTEMLKRFKCDSRIVKTFDNEKEAYNFEYDYIKIMKSKGKCVCNIYNGGAGGSGEYWTDELRQEYSKKNVMKSEKQRERMRKHNPMKNPEIAAKTNALKRKPVIVGDVEYPSVKIACQTLNVTSEAIASWCKKGINRKGEKCHYKGQEQVIFKDKRYNKGGCRPLIYGETYYESPIDLALELNCSVYKIYRWIKKEVSDDGIVCKYIDNK